MMMVYDEQTLVWELYNLTLLTQDQAMQGGTTLNLDLVLHAPTLTVPPVTVIPCIPLSLLSE